MKKASDVGRDWERVKALGLKPGITSVEDYSERVQKGTARALRNLQREGFIILGPESVERVHRDIFEDVYTWTGFRRPNQVPGVSHEVGVGGFKGTYWEKIPSALRLSETEADKALENTRSDMQQEDILQKAEAIAEYHANLLKTHPFLDGNGRCARVILAFQIKRLFGATMLQDFDKRNYIDCLNEFRHDFKIERLRDLIIDLAGMGHHLSVEKASAAIENTEPIPPEPNHQPQPPTTEPELVDFKNEHRLPIDFELVRRIEGLSEEEYSKLPQSQKDAYFQNVTWINIPESDDDFIVRIEGGSVNYYPRNENQMADQDDWIEAYDGSDRVRPIEGIDAGPALNQVPLDFREAIYRGSMLSISQPIHGVGKANYYLQLAKEDYYLNGGEPPGIWTGRGAAYFKLSGEVQREQLHNLLLGYCPEKIRKLVQNAGDLKRASAWDLTFSAPKSVSVVWALGSADTRLSIQKAQERATQYALEYLEDVAGLSRTGKQGGKLEKASLIFATFEHGTSRAQDPQLHTHCLLINSCLRADETTGTVWSHNFFRHKMAAGALYRTALAHELSQLGFQLEAVPKGFEIKGVNHELCDFFSKRRQEIEQLLEQRGQKGAKASEAAAFQSRETKVHTPRQELFKEWEKIGKKFGLGMRQIEELKQEGKPHRRDANGEMLHIIQQSLDEVSRNHSFFAERVLVREVAERAAPLGLPPQSIVRAVQGALEGDSLVRLGEHKGEALYSTQSTLDKEKAILEIAARSATDTQHRVAADKVERVLAKHGHLTEEQRAAVRHITTEQGSIKLVNGLAGTGKSSMLDVARQIWEKDNLTVLGTSFTGKATRGLEESANIQSFTLSKLLHELEKPSVGIEIRQHLIAPNAPKWSPVHGTTVPYLAFFAKEKEFRIDKNTVIVLDEASMVSTNQLHALTNHCQKVGAKLVAVGDPKQLQSIEAGGGFVALEKTLGSSKLSDIRRQVDPGMRSIVEHLSQGDAKVALEKAQQQDLLHIATNKTQAMDALISQWKANGGLKNPQNHFIMSGTNESVKSLNRFAQDARRQAGELGLSSVKVNGERMFNKDRVLFTKISSSLGVENGSFGTITHLGNKQLSVKLDSGKIVQVPLHQYDHLQLGYAATTHKAQGATVKYGYVFLRESMQDMHMAYVEASRATHLTRFYTDKQTAGKDLGQLAALMSQAHPKLFATQMQEQINEKKQSYAHKAGDARHQHHAPTQEKGPTLG